MECTECNNIAKKIAETQKNFEYARSQPGSYAVDAEQTFPLEIERLKSELDEHLKSPYCKKVKK